MPHHTLAPDDTLTDILHDIEAALMLHPLLPHDSLARLLEGLDRIEARLNEPPQADCAGECPDIGEETERRHFALYREPCAAFADDFGGKKKDEVRM